MAIFSSTRCGRRAGSFRCRLRETQLASVWLRLVNHHARDLVRLAETPLKLLAVRVQIDRFLRDATFHRRLGHGDRFPQQHARIEWLGNQVVRSKLQPLDAIRTAN